MTRNIINFVLVPAIVTALWLGCGEEPDWMKRMRGEPTRTPYSPYQTPTPQPGLPTAPSLGNPFEPDGLKSLVDGLKKARGQKLRVVVMDISAMSALVVIQNPNKKNEMEVFEWRGGRLSDPKTPKQAGSGDLESSLFDLDEVALDKIPDLVKEAQEKTADMEGKYTDKHLGVSIKRGLPATKDVQINVIVTANKKKARLIADKNGNVKEFKTE